MRTCMVIQSQKKKKKKMTCKLFLYSVAIILWILDVLLFNSEFWEGFYWFWVSKVFCGQKAKKKWLIRIQRMCRGENWSQIIFHFLHSFLFLFFSVLTFNTIQEIGNKNVFDYAHGTFLNPKLGKRRRLRMLMTFML